MDNIEWGDSIKVSGRPNWLHDNEVIHVTCADGYCSVEAVDHLEGIDGSGTNWFTGEHCQPADIISSIRLPADHPYYTIQQYNAKHGTNFKYWPGGESAPDDWDGGETFIMSDGKLWSGSVSWWNRTDSWSVIIGYHPRKDTSVNPVDFMEPIIRDISHKTGLEVDEESLEAARAYCNEMVTLHTEPQSDDFKTESPIRAFTDWQVTGLYALGKGFRPSLAHLTKYLDAIHVKEGWALVQILEATTSAPSFLFRRVHP